MAIETTKIVIFFVCMACVLLGWCAAWYTLIKTCDGSIILRDDEIYLSLTNEDAKKLEKAAYATIRIKRKNFSGFNGGDDDNG